MYKLEYKLDCKKKAIGARIAEERKKLGLTQDELSEKLFMGRIAVSQIETGKKLPNTKTATLLCELFNCEMAYLWCEIDTKKYETTDICKTTNLSESAVQNILDLNRGTKPLIGDLRTENIKTLDKILSDRDLKYLLQAISDYRNNKQSDKDSQDFELFKLQNRFISLVNNLDDKN